MPSNEQNPDPQLPAILDLAAAEPLAQVLEAQLTTGALQIDGSGVERVSTPCLQVLAATAVSARRRGQAFVLRRPSDVLQAAIADLGLIHAIPTEE